MSSEEINDIRSLIYITRQRIRNSVHDYSVTELADAVEALTLVVEKLVNQGPVRATDQRSIP